nr:DUF559 domain-containing protein [Microbacterium bovistercoris]
MAAATAKKTPRELAAAILPATFLGPAALVEQGIGRRQVTALVAGEQLIRLRNGRYVGPDTPAELVRAGRLGARLDCVSLLSSLGIFVHTHDALHVQVPPKASRLPVPAQGVIRHWRPSSRRRGALAADVVEALAQACRCQQPRHALATMDSAWHHGIVDEKKINAVFARLPRRFRRLRGLLDKKAESGPETLVRLMLRGLGCDAVVQVRIPRVGRVDIVVDGWLIVECDSEEFHSGWTAQKRDRRRDLEAAAQGYTTIRLLAEDILYHPERVLAALKAVLATAPHRR